MTSEAAGHARTPKDSFWLPIIYIVSALLCAAVLFLIYGPRPAGPGALDVSALPTVNASLNALTATLLVVGWRLIKKKRVAQHKAVMLTAFGTSSGFLVSYVIYHWFKDGPAQYTGAFKPVYLFILLTHIVLAAIILPLALVTLYRGWSVGAKGGAAKHRKIARITLPLWLYVSVTGVAIYAMLYL
jgi:putative membrane protein